MAHPDRVADRPGPARRTARGGRNPARRLPPRARRRRGQWHAPAAGHVHRRPRRGGGQRGARVRVRGSDRYVGLRRGRLRNLDVPPAGRRPGADHDVVHPSRFSRRAVLRPFDSRKKPECIPLAVVVRRPAHGPGRGAGSARGHGQLLAGLALQRDLPRPSVAQLPGAQRSDAQGPELRPHRRHHGGRHHLAARDPRRGAQLGLPLHLDPRLIVHAALAVPARVRLGGIRILRVRAGGGDGGRRRLQPADHVRHRRSEGPDRAHPRPLVGLAELEAGAGGQRRLGPAPERRLGDDPRRRRRQPPSRCCADREARMGRLGHVRRGRHLPLGGPGPGHLGDPG